MARKTHDGEDTVLNMTPMIDVCFQLVVFFMLTLRFKSIDRRFQSALPKDRGQSSAPATVTPFQDITVKLFRENLEDTNVSNQYTMVRVGEMKKIELPRGPWSMKGDDEDTRRRKEDKIFEEVTALIADAWEKQGKNPEVKGEIKTPFPKGQSVPHGDVMRVLDCFLAAGIQQVNFEGAAAPLMKKDGGGWEFNN